MLGRQQAHCGGGVASSHSRKMSLAHSFQVGDGRPDLYSQVENLPYLLNQGILCHTHTNKKESDHS